MRKITLLLSAGIIASLLTTACSGELFPEPEEINAPETRGREINPDLPPLEPIPDDDRLPLVGIHTIHHVGVGAQVWWDVFSGHLPEYPLLAGYEIYGANYYGIEPNNWKTLYTAQGRASAGNWMDTTQRPQQYAYSVRAYGIDPKTETKIYGPRSIAIHTSPGGGGDDSDGPSFPIKP